MFLRVIVLFLATVIFTGCPQPGKDPKKAKGKQDQPQMADQSGDTAFQAFNGRLRKAVELHDRTMLASMMTADFGYRWDNGPAGETPFAYWDKNRLWGELSAVLRERWTPHGAFMVSPPQFAQNENYPGYRAGVTMVGGSWRFAYFVSAPSAAAATPEVSNESSLPPLPQ